MTNLEEVEIQIDIAKEMIALRDSYFKLSTNRNFKNVIEKAYFKEEAARLVMAKSSFLDAEQQANVDNMIYGIGALANFFDMIVRRGNEMEQALEDHQSTREEILAEELNEAV